MSDNPGKAGGKAGHTNGPESPPDTFDTTDPDSARRPRKWLMPTLLALTAVIIISLILLPVAIQYSLRNWLLENGAQQVAIADVDVNLFSGTAQLEDVRIEVDDHPTLILDNIGLNFAWQALLQRRITLTGIHLRGTHIDIRQSDNGELRIGGILLPASTADKTPEQHVADAELAIEDAAGNAAVKTSTLNWGVGIDTLNLTDVSIHYAMPQLAVDTQIEQLSLKNLAQWTPEKPAQIALRASINGAALTYNGGLAPFADSLLVDGQVDLRELALADFQQIAGLVGANEKLAGTLSLKTDFSLTLGEKTLEAQLQNGALQLDKLQLHTADIQLQQQALNWAGDLSLNQADTLSLQSSGTLSLADLVAQLPAQKLALSQQALQLGVAVTVEKGAGDVAIQLQLDDTQISALTVTADGFPLAGLQQLRINQLTFTSPQAQSPLTPNPAQLNIAQLDTEQLYVAKPTGDDKIPALFSNRSLRLENLALNLPEKGAQAFAVERIALKGAHIYISRAADERTNIDDLLAVIEGLSSNAVTDDKPGEKARANVPSETAAQSQPGRFHIGQLRVSDDSTVVINDAGVTPTTRIDISIANLAVDNLDNSSPDQVTKIQAQGKFGRFGSYTLSGDAQPFADTINGKLSASIKGIDLPRLSPYTTRSLGFRLRSGTLADNIDVVIKQDQISGNTELTLYQLELIPLQTKEGSSGDMTAASLNTSLNMLRDKNNTIVLKIPLSGDINAPDFSIQNALNQALMSGVQTGVMTYALLALQPYGTMVVLAKYAGEAVTKLRLDPVTFEPGGSDISATGKDYLSKVATILMDRPKVAVKVCGVAVASDAAALLAGGEKAAGKAADSDGERTSANAPALSEEQLQTKLRQLARQRSIAVREFLINQTKANSTQLISCMPAIERDESGGLPRADLLI